MQVRAARMQAVYKRFDSLINGIGRFRKVVHMTSGRSARPWSTIYSTLVQFQGRHQRQKIPTLLRWHIGNDRLVLVGLYDEPGLVNLMVPHTVLTRGSDERLTAKPPVTKPPPNAFYLSFHSAAALVLLEQRSMFVRFSANLGGPVSTAPAPPSNVLWSSQVPRAC